MDGWMIWADRLFLTYQDGEGRGLGLLMLILRERRGGGGAGGLVSSWKEGVSSNSKAGK